MNHYCPRPDAGRGVDPSAPRSRREKPRPYPDAPPPSFFPAALGVRSRQAEEALCRLERMLLGLGGCERRRGDGGRLATSARRLRAELHGSGGTEGPWRPSGTAGSTGSAPQVVGREVLLGVLGELLELADDFERAGRHRAALALEGAQGRLLEAVLCDAGPGAVG